MGSVPGLGDPWRREWQRNSNILAWRIPWTEEPGGRSMIHKGAKSQTQLKPFSTKLIIHGSHSPPFFVFKSYHMYTCIYIFFKFLHNDMLNDEKKKRMEIFILILLPQHGGLWCILSAPFPISPISFFSPSFSLSFSSF